MEDKEYKTAPEDGKYSDRMSWLMCLGTEQKYNILTYFVHRLKN